MEVPIPALGPEQVALLEGGCALIVAYGEADGAPRATRAWGLRVLASDPARVRIVLDDADRARLARSGDRLAVTGADVRTLVSVQLKGRVAALDDADDADVERFEQYFDRFAADVRETDGTERWQLERLVPHAFAATELDVDEVYDQTPGPGAGAALHVAPS